MIYSPKRITLPADGNFKRVPPRAPKDRQENYLERFDFNTLFSDVFIRNKRVWMIGPPFLNLEREITNASFLWNWEDVSDSVVFENFNRMSRASFPVEDINGVLQIASSLGNWELNVDTPPDFGFTQSNLLVTQQQDNRLEWIAYWALFNVQVNGVNSMVIYDNCSELYPAERIAQILARIPGLDNFVVVKWDTPYGVPGGPNSVWDSDFGQHISWEHCRHAFAHSANSVCIIDIDELPFTLSGKTLTEELESSAQPAIFFNRQPIRQYPNRSPELTGSRIHADFSLGEQKGAWLASKYIYSPDLLRDNAQLLVHRIEGLGADTSPSTSVFAGHFDAIRVRWRHGEKNQVPTVPSPSSIAEPVEVVSALDIRFDQLRESWQQLNARIANLLNSQSL